MGTKLSRWFSLGLLLLCEAAAAHHSFAALFDTTRSVTVTGQVVEFEFQAPHSYVHLRTAEEPAVTWQLETATPGMLIRIGLTPEVLQPGQTISATGSPARDGRPLMRLLTVELPDGTVFELQ
jgi:hypothetical protein